MLSSWSLWVNANFSSHYGLEEWLLKEVNGAFRVCMSIKKSSNICQRCLQLATQESCLHSSHLCWISPYASVYVCVQSQFSLYQRVEKIFCSALLLFYFWFCLPQYLIAVLSLSVFLSPSPRQCHIGSKRKWCRVTTTGSRGTTGARGSVATGLHPSTTEWPITPVTPPALHLLMETTGLGSFLFLLSPPSYPLQSL